jgi:hypothetical protein
VPKSNHLDDLLVTASATARMVNKVRELK